MFTELQVGWKTLGCSYWTHMHCKNSFRFFWLLCGYHSCTTLEHVV